MYVSLTWLIQSGPDVVWSQAHLYFYNDFLLNSPTPRCEAGLFSFILQWNCDKFQRNRDNPVQYHAVFGSRLLIDMSQKSIFLVGAPLSSNLDWDTDELLNVPIPPFHDEKVVGSAHQLPLDQPPVKWRLLRPSTEKLGESYAAYEGPEDPAFLISHQLAVMGEASTETSADRILSQFYDHSFTVHETSEVSSSTDMADSGHESSLEGNGTTIIRLENEDVPPSPHALHIPGPLSELQELPTAKYLQSIAPQTMTVNLIAGILAIHPPRRVVTRQWKTELDIIELVVGDETRAGFGVTCWTKPDKSAKTRETDRLGQSLASLRPHDIVLFRTIGLSTFQDRVYGQSLRGGITTVELLHRKPLDMTDAVGFYQGRISSDSGDQPLLKVCRVRNWMLRFVADAAGGGVSSPRGLPPDTQ